MTRLVSAAVVAAAIASGPATGWWMLRAAWAVVVWVWLRDPPIMSLVYAALVLGLLAVLLVERGGAGGVILRVVVGPMRRHKGSFPPFPLGGPGVAVAAPAVAVVTVADVIDLDAYRETALPLRRTA